MRSFRSARNRPIKSRPTTPSPKFCEKGPNVGLFTLCWVDSWGTLARFVPRQGLRDLEVRILSRCRPTIRIKLIDSSAANKLEAHAMIYFDETDGKIVKFRPYQL